MECAAKWHHPHRLTSLLFLRGRGSRSPRDPKLQRSSGSRHRRNILDLDIRFADAVAPTSQSLHSISERFQQPASLPYILRSPELVHDSRSDGGQRFALSAKHPQLRSLHVDLDQGRHGEFARSEELIDRVHRDVDDTSLSGEVGPIAGSGVNETSEARFAAGPSASLPLRPTRRGVPSTATFARSLRRASPRARLPSSTPVPRRRSSPSGPTRLYRSWCGTRRCPVVERDVMRSAVLDQERNDLLLVLTAREGQVGGHERPVPDHAGQRARQDGERLRRVVVDGSSIGPGRKAAPRRGLNPA